MLRYRLRYQVETSIEYRADVSLAVAGHQVTLCFSEKKGAAEKVRAQVDVEACNANEAILTASENVLPPVLDSLSFATGVPLLLHDCDLVLKNETGSKTRRARYVNVSQLDSPVLVKSEQIAEAQQILDAGKMTLPMCWHRYAAHRGYALDRFLFQWLALEGLAGTVQVPVACPECGHVRTHAGSDKNKAFDLFKAVSPETSQKDFNEHIWGKARNAVFHGTGYPKPSFLARLNSLSPTLRKACEKSFCREFGVADTPRSIRGPSTWQLYLFVEWQTQNASRDYADDFPEDSVSKLGGHREIGEVGVNAPQVSGFSLLDMNRDYVGW